MNAQPPNQPLLTVDSDPRQSASGSVSVCNLDPDLMVSLGRHLQAGGRRSPSSELMSFEREHRMVTIFQTFLAAITFWKTGFGSYRTFHSSGDFHIEQALTPDRSVVPNSQT